MMPPEPQSKGARAGVLTVFLVEHDEAVRDALTIVLEIAGLNVAAFGSALHFLEVYPNDGHGCLVVDVDMPGIDGLQLVRLLVDCGVALPTIATTARLSSHRLGERLPAGVVFLLEKPFGEDEFLGLVARAMAGTSRGADAGTTA
jgi:two-component system, LuxR family, response regulator FixJ